MLIQSPWKSTLRLGLALVLTSGFNVVALAQSQGLSDSPSKTQPSSQAEAPDKDETKVTKDKPKKVKIGGIEWYVDYDAAMKIAIKENKPLWLHFGENPG